jgi:hypothetical protein
MTHFNWIIGKILKAFEALEFNGGFEVLGEIFLLAEFLIDDFNEII